MSKPTLFSLMFLLFSTLTPNAVWSNDGDDVKELAHEIAKQAEYVHEEAEASSHHRDYLEQRALQDLHTLEQRAHHYHQQVEKYYQDMRHTESDYNNLISAYKRARNSFYSLHAFRHVRADFDRLGRSIERLRSYYEYNRQRGLKEMAHEIDELAEQIHEDAEHRTSHYPNRYEQMAISRLHQLAQQASHFHRQVEAYRQDPRHTVRDYQNLLFTFRQARETFYWLSSSHELQYDFNRLGQNIEQLSQYYRGTDNQGMKELAHRVDEMAKRVHESAEDSAHHNDRAEQRALKDLHVLAEKAEHFHAQVEAYYQDPSHTRQDYNELIHAFNLARSSFYHLHTFAHVRVDFDMLGRSIRELRRYYSRSGEHQPRNPHRDPHQPRRPQHPRNPHGW